MPGLLIPALSKPAGMIAIGSLIIVVLFNGRKSKNIVGRIGSGLYRVYGGTDYLKDILSYSRIFALGLGSGIMAIALNTMIQMIPGGTIIGMVLIVIAFTAGHAFNFAMNLLSGYVHTSRLQYVEFFSKFYESGGKEFRPFAERSKYTEITY